MKSFLHHRKVWQLISLLALMLLALNVEAEPSGSMQAYYNNPTKAPNAWQLNGTFCHYSGSSSYGSSYSHTEMITFNGQGRWTMGSQSTFSSNAGSGYSGNGNAGTGLYLIEGNKVLYQTAEGEQGAAQVNMQQSDGRITEIYVDGELYSPSLCD